MSRAQRRRMIVRASGRQRARLVTGAAAVGSTALAVMLSIIVSTPTSSATGSRPANADVSGVDLPSTDPVSVVPATSTPPAPPSAPPPATSSEPSPPAPAPNRNQLQPPDQPPAPSNNGQQDAQSGGS